MNRSDRHRCVFFHVPRTGGSSIETLDWWNQWTGHLPAAVDADVPVNHFSFAVVRNPWDRFVSLYHYFATMTPAHRWYVPNARIADDVQRIGSFSEFCRTFHGWRHRDNLHFQPQCRWIADADGKLLVDFVARFEQLQADFARVCRRLDTPAVELPMLNGSRHGPFRDYYDDQSRDIVAELSHEDLSHEDIVTFGYQP